MRKLRTVAVGISLVALTVGQIAAAGVGSRGPSRAAHRSAMALKRSVQASVAKHVRSSPLHLESEVECIAARKPGAANVNLDCDDGLAPNNEPDIEVDPLDPLHMIASSNDYDSCCDEFYTSFDGGDTWVTGDMSAEGPFRIGSDPVTVFDPVTGHAIHSSLNFLFVADGADDGDLVVSISTDGGLVWGKPVVVADGEGDDNDPLQIFHDKEWMVTDTNPASPHYGRTYLTWTAFVAEFGEYIESPIYEAHSDDGGLTWSAPQEISGSSSSFCTFQTAGPSDECDENQFSVPTVAPNGTVYVAFEGSQNEAAWEAGEQFETAYLVVRSTDGGYTWSDPVKIADLEDGSRDYPVNVDGRQTLSGLQIRVNSAGNIVADPDTGMLHLVFSDNRQGVHDSDDPVTETKVFITSSADGVTWTVPVAVDQRPGDQWFPWADVNPVTGDVGVIYHNRLEEAPELYVTRFAVGAPGSFASAKVNTAPSNPKQSAWFRAYTKGCWLCAAFHGDYLRVAYGSDGAANLVWTDMRRLIDRGTAKPGYTENIFFARV
ncbi:MAG: sialidase family protein [Actinomycetota bacterium]